VSGAVLVAVLLAVLFLGACVWAWREADEAERAEGIDL